METQLLAPRLIFDNVVLTVYMSNRTPDQADFNLRGHFTTDKIGRYGLYCLRPVPYPVSDDGNYVIGIADD